MRNPKPRVNPAATPVTLKSSTEVAIMIGGGELPCCTTDGAQASMEVSKE